MITLEAMSWLRRLFAASQPGGRSSFLGHTTWNLWWTAFSLSTMFFHSQYPFTNALLIQSYTTMLYNLSNQNHHILTH